MNKLLPAMPTSHSKKLDARPREKSHLDKINIRFNIMEFTEHIA
jgi:hypothetical protein